jgi:hypothetical protein
MKRLFYTALEETMSMAQSESSQKKSAVVAGRVLNFGTKKGVRIDREADYMCFSPLRRKTSELEGEEYTIRIVSGIDRLDPPLRLCTAFVCGATAFGETGKSADLLAQIQPSSRWRHRSTNIRPM